MENKTFEEICNYISDIYNHKIFIELDQLEKLFVKFTKLLFMRIFKIDREPIVEITDGDKYAGCYNGYVTFSINREQVKKFQNGMALDLFETICHELNHFAQRRNYKNINIKNSIIEKDSYLKEKIEGYYNSNYDFLMTEVDSFLSQSKDAIDILNALGIVPSNEELELSNKLKARYSQNAMITKRIVGEEIKDLNELFAKILEHNSREMDDFAKNNFLEFCPCLNIEYKIADEKIVKRSAEEIKQIYNQWQNGNLQLPGLENEIDMYFKYTIENITRLKEEPIKQKTF